MKTAKKEIEGEARDGFKKTDTNKSDQNYSMHYCFIFHCQKLTVLEKYKFYEVIKYFDVILNISLYPVCIFEDRALL